jgi:hypothetical protein
MKLSCLLVAALLAACVSEPPADLPASEEAASGPSASPPASPATSGVEQEAAIADPDDDAIPVASREIARVRLFYGELVYSVSAEGEPDDAGELMSRTPAVQMLELSRTDSAGQTFEVAGERSPLDTYLATTPSTVPVPRALLDSEDSTEVRGRALARPIVEALSAPVQGLARLDLVSVITPVASSAPWCSGTTSASFAADVCPLNNWDVDYCHNGTWHSVTDGVGSSNKKRWSRGRTYPCGANGRVRHYYKSGGLWYKPIDEPVPSNTLMRSTRKGSWALQRKVTHSRTASGFVRAASHFHIPF